jgi:methionine synthase II (cobalamin-independent)
MNNPKRPLFRADHVGSLLRPDPVKQARQAFYENKTIDASVLEAAENEAVIDLVKLQESVGLQVVTDGEATLWEPWMVLISRIAQRALLLQVFN